MDEFCHLRVASSFSMRYGASTPQALVDQAAGYGMSRLAITDRDGLYGAVRFVEAAQKAGIAPVVGVDLAVADASGRVVVLATPGNWGELCGIVSAAQGRESPAVKPQDLAQARGLVTVLGSDSPFGLAAARGDRGGAETELARWVDMLGPRLVVGVTDHFRRDVASPRQAARMASLASAGGVGIILTNQVRMATGDLLPVCDVLDSARTLTPLTATPRRDSTAQAWLKPGAMMRLIGERIALRAGLDANEIWAATLGLAERCALDPERDIGLGSHHLPTTGRLGVLRARCEETLARRMPGDTRARERLADELRVIDELGFEPYFCTVARVVDMIRGMGIRCSARGSGAGSLVNYLLGISGINPLDYGLLMERFCSPLRATLPDIDLDVESARRPEIYRAIFAEFGDVACVGMYETYRVRHAVRDVGRALGMPAGQVGALAKAFPRVRARQIREASRNLPEVRRLGLSEERFGMFFDLVTALDGLPRGFATHPCGVVLGDETLLDRTPVQPSPAGYRLSQFDKEDVVSLGLIKLDVLGVRMQSAIAYARDEVKRTTGECIDLDGLAPFDDDPVYAMIGRAQTIGCFQIESPGQRELVGKFGPQTFDDIIIDISLFRPGPVKADMVTPFLEARQGWAGPRTIHPDLAGILEPTCGVVVFHEQVIELIATLAGVSRAEGDVKRRLMADRANHPAIREWFVARARERGYEDPVIEEVWQVLVSFGSFGFCKAHAAAFALTTYQSAWLRRYWPAQFVAGLLEHDPGMYPPRLIVAEARRMGVAVLGIDVNESGAHYRVDGGVRYALSAVKDIDTEEVARIVAGQPYFSISDFCARAEVSRPIVQSLIRVGAFDALYGIDLDRPGDVTRRDLMLAASQAEADGPGVNQPALMSGCGDVIARGLPEMTWAEHVAAEIEILGVDIAAHVMASYREFLGLLGVCWAGDLVGLSNRSEVLIAGAKVATQTPPMRSGKRVIFLSLDDESGVSDITFFTDVQDDYASVVFSSWLLVAAGTTRRTGPRGISVRGVGAWELGELYRRWRELVDRGESEAAAATAVRDSLVAPHSGVVPHATQSGRKLWHSSPGSSGR